MNVYAANYILKMSISSLFYKKIRKNTDTNNVSVLFIDIYFSKFMDGFKDLLFVLFESIEILWNSVSIFFYLLSIFCELSTAIVALTTQWWKKKYFLALKF